MNSVHGYLLAIASIIHNTDSIDRKNEIQFISNIFIEHLQKSCLDELISIPGTNYKIMCSEVTYILPRGVNCFEQKYSTF